LPLLLNCTSERFGNTTTKPSHGVLIQAKTILCRVSPSALVSEDRRQRIKDNNIFIRPSTIGFN
jgi:hypothetical protein